MSVYESPEVTGTARILLMTSCEVKAGTGSPTYHANLNFRIAGLTNEISHEPDQLRWVDFSNSLFVQDLEFHLWNTDQFDLQTYTLADPKFRTREYQGIDLQMAERHLKALRGIQARERLIASRSGHVASVVENLRRQVSVFGVEELWIPHDVHFHNYKKESHLVINLKKEPAALEQLLKFVSKRLEAHDTFKWARKDWMRFEDFLDQQEHA